MDWCQLDAIRLGVGKTWRDSARLNSIAFLLKVRSKRNYRYLSYCAVLKRRTNNVHGLSKSLRTAFCLIYGFYLCYHMMLLITDIVFLINILQLL
jgi:hypothetical protein